MLTRLLVRMILLAAFAGGLSLELQKLSATQVHAKAAFDSSSTADEKMRATMSKGSQLRPSWTR